MKFKFCSVRVVAVILSLLLSLTVVGCSRDEKDDRRPLTVWVYSSEYRDQLLSCFEEDFTAIDWYPNIVVVEPDDLDSALNDAAHSGKGLPDIFMLSPDKLQSYVQSDTTADLSALDISLSENSYYKYTIDSGTDADGTLKAVCWQPDPGLFFYRRSIAKAYLGTDDPDDIQSMISTWDGFMQTASTIRDESRGKTYMTVGIEDIMRAYMAADTDGWVFDGRLTVSSTAVSFLEYAEQLAKNDLIYNAEQWSAAWVAGISDPQSVFGYFSSGMGMRSVLKKACGGTIEGDGTFGDWAAVKGPQSYNWGGCWFAVHSDTQMSDEAAVFLQYFITEQEAVSKNCLVNGTFSSCKPVVEQVKFDAQFYEAFLGGQNYYLLLAEVADDISMEGLSEYSTVINAAFVDCVSSCVFGYKNRDTALSDFIHTIQEAYPELV